MGKHRFKKVGPVNVQEICVKCGEHPQAKNGRGWLSGDLQTLQ